MAGLRPFINLPRLCYGCRPKTSLLFYKNCPKSTYFKALQSTSTQDGNATHELPAKIEVSKEDFGKWVVPLLPMKFVPPIPEHESYPTPSGWFPPNEELISQEKYLVRRTKNHHLPVYAKKTVKEFRTQHYVQILHIEGDIWALEADLRMMLEKEADGDFIIRTRVHELGRQIEVRGLYAPLIAEYLLNKGF